MYYERDAKPVGLVPSVPNYGNWREANEEAEARESGLHGRQLFALLAALALLAILAAITLLCNILLLSFLRVGHRGMDMLQFHKVPDADTGVEEHVVEFRGERVELDSVVTSDGHVGGYSGKDLYVQGSRVLLSSRSSQNASDGGAKVQLILEDGRIRLENVRDFDILSNDIKDPQVYFRAALPKFITEKKIRQISMRQIVTNKLRAPVGEHLLVSAENVLFRGNEGNAFTSRAFNATARGSASLQTSANGAIRLKAAGGTYLGTEFALSSSPDPKANELGRRLCACIQTDRLFTVPGNMPCTIDPGFCY